MGNQSRCNCHTFGIFLRILSIITYIGLAVAAAWGYLLAIKYFEQGKRILLFDLTAETMGVYIGLMASYYIIFSFLGFFAELRNELILQHFGFLRTHLGRGFYMFFLGSTFVLIPWDEERTYVAKIPGSFQLACGISQIIYSLCVVSSDDGTEDSRGSSSSRRPPLSPGQTIAWGSSEQNNGPDVIINNNSSSLLFPPTPGKDSTTVNLVASSESEIGSSSNDPTVQVVKNPFAFAVNK